MDSQLLYWMLIFSKQERDQHQTGNLNDIISNLSKMLKRIIGEDITIRHDFTPSIWPTMVNQGKFEQVIMNLVINARDAMERGGNLTISTKNICIDEENLIFYPLGRTGKFVCISVEDSGSGMD